MAQVSFHTGVPERLAYVCRLLRKAQLAGARVGVVGPGPLLDRLDRELWVFGPTEFVPHIRLRPGRGLAPRLARTPIQLTEHADELPHRDVLLNVGPELPEGFEGFARVIEVVAGDAEQAQRGRERFRQYQQLGHPIEHHKVA
ncbi:MAG: DNA polymerase III subunit chi [Paucibacter sp.]|nr:DNA polymerase III subunit chi [Roseateles sp.]